MPSLSDKHPTASRWVLAAGLLLIASLMSMMTAPATAQNVVLKDGAVFEGNRFNFNKYDPTYLLTSRTVSSYVQFISCTIVAEIASSYSFENPPDTLVTSEYIKWVNTIHQTYGTSTLALPPNSYTHSVGSQNPTYVDHRHHYIFFFSGNKFNENVTIHVEDANIGFAPFYPLFTMVTGSHTVVHVSGVKVQKKGTETMKDFLLHHSVVANDDREVDPPKLSRESVFYFENCECVGCSQAIIYFQHDVYIADTSALIFRGITNRNPEGSKPFFSCGGSILGGSILVEEMGVFSLIDIDTANDFKASSIPLFKIKSIISEGVVMLARVSMQKSGFGLGSAMQPVYNDHFYVSARATRSEGAEMTTTQLLEEKFNVNDANTMNWDGTDVNGNCVQAGLALPDRATYTKVDGNCTATCNNGNIPPACTAPYVNPCLSTNCDICHRKDRTKCLVCQAHTTHVAKSDQCKCKFPNCAVCPSEGVCTECIPDYDFDKDGTCVRCVIPNCNQCSRDNICADCADGYKASGDKTKCFKCKIPNCQQCSEDDKCEIFCDPDNPANNGKDCYRCVVEGCQECKEDGTCRTCEAGHKPSADGTQCFKCEMPQCSQCSADDKCHSCEDGHKPANNGKDCYPCNVKNCQECKADGTCLTCDAGAELSAEDGKCYQCTVENCNSCTSDGVCGQCADGYKPANNAKECVHCAMPHCSECSGNDVCASCDAPYKPSLEDGQCYQCSMANCNSCTSDGVCGKCADGYKPANNGKDCYPCNVKNCQECKADGTCLTCDAGAELSPEDGKCYQCTVENCNSCTSDGVCGQCADGYKPANNAKECVHCAMSHCSACSGNDVCSSCDAPYKPSLEDGQCYQCSMANCNSCTSDGVCGQCADGYKPANNDKECVHCAMPHCSACSADGACEQCAEGYKPSADRKSCLQCAESNCAQCGTNNDCQRCDDDHTLTKKGECISCDLPGCQRCDLGGVCAMCDGAQETVTADGSECVSCSIGNCTYCSDDGKCAMCACGMVPTNDGSSCVACDVANCVHCDLPGDGHTCAECASGYALSDDGDTCERVSMPPWAVFLIVAFITVGIVVAAYVAMFLYLRHEAKQLEKATHAAVRRRNRQDNYYHHRTEFLFLDIGDIENAASGIRDVNKEICLKGDDG